MKRISYLVGVALAAALAAPAGAQTYQQAVQSTNPEAYFRLTNPAAGSTTGGFSTTYQGSVATGPGAPVVADPGNTGAVFDGVNSATPGIISTTLSGGVPGAGTILAWVNLAALPSTTGSIFYVAGESDYGNDLDLQFVNDDSLRFYTGAGEFTGYSPAAGSLVGQWHLIAATYDATLGGSSFRNIYWDGALGAGFTGGVNSASKSSPFTIGYSSLFGGREFAGSIDEVAVYNRALSASEVSSIYAARLNPAVAPGAVPEPATWALMIAGFGMAGAAMRRRVARADNRPEPSMIERKAA